MTSVYSELCVVPVSERKLLSAFITPPTGSTMSISAFDNPHLDSRSHSSETLSPSAVLIPHPIVNSAGSSVGWPPSTLDSYLRWKVVQLPHQDLLVFLTQSVSVVLACLFLLLCLSASAQWVRLWCLVTNGLPSHTPIASRPRCLIQSLSWAVIIITAMIIIIFFFFLQSRLSSSTSVLVFAWWRRISPLQRCPSSC
jgi:hypothetical protein